jgi:hypothetical protein
VETYDDGDATYPSNLELGRSSRAMVAVTQFVATVAWNGGGGGDLWLL